LNLLSDGHVQAPASGVTEYGKTTASLSNGGSMTIADVAFATQLATTKTGSIGQSDVFKVESDDKLVKILGFELDQPSYGGDQVDLSALMASLGASAEDLRWVTSGNDLALQVIQAQGVSAAVVFADLGRLHVNTELLMQHIVM